MTEVTVFVDDAVRGELPGVCAKDGAPATGRFRLVTEVGSSNRLGIAWLLVFAGPLGWLVLLFLTGRDSGEKLTVELPYCDDDHERYVAARRRRTWAILAGVGWVGLVVLLAAVGVLAYLELLVALIGFLVALCVAWVAEVQMHRAGVSVVLDASRRWVTLQRVHPDFAAACEVEQERRHRQGAAR